MIHALKKESQALGCQQEPFRCNTPPAPLRGGMQGFCWRSLLGGRTCADSNLSLQSANLQHRPQDAYLGMVSGHITGLRHKRRFSTGFEPRTAELKVKTFPVVPPRHHTTPSADGRFLRLVVFKVTNPVPYHRLCESLFDDNLVIL